MPLKPIFPSNAPAVRLAPKLNEILKKVSKTHKVSLIELVNYTLADKFAPELLKEFEAYKAKPLKFPNRVTKNRFTR